jgi:hypothetical protein
MEESYSAGPLKATGPRHQYFLLYFFSIYGINKYSNHERQTAKRVGHKRPQGRHRAATSNKQQATSNKQQATSNKQQAIIGHSQFLSTP